MYTTSFAHSYVCESQGSLSRHLESIKLHVGLSPKKTPSDRASALLQDKDADRPLRRFTFMAFRPDAFRALRQIYKVSEDEYVTALQATCKIRLSEGASNAFFFFSKCERFIVKSMQKSECEVSWVPVSPISDLPGRH